MYTLDYHIYSLVKRPGLRISARNPLRALTFRRVTTCCIGSRDASEEPRGMDCPGEPLQTEREPDGLF